jgi:hypothetical protein
MMEMEFQKIESRSINYVSLGLYTEEGCNPLEGEYSLSILSFMGSLDISREGGVDDISLIKECIENDLDFDKLPKEGMTEIILKESGEWEDVFWHKYYEIERVVSN